MVTCGRGGVHMPSTELILGVFRCCCNNAAAMEVNFVVLTSLLSTPTTSVFNILYGVLLPLLLIILCSDDQEVALTDSTPDHFTFM